MTATVREQYFGHFDGDGLPNAPFDSPWSTVCAYCGATNFDPYETCASNVALVVLKALREKFPGTGRIITIPPVSPSLSLRVPDGTGRSDGIELRVAHRVRAAHDVTRDLRVSAHALDRDARFEREIAEPEATDERASSRSSRSCSSEHGRRRREAQATDDASDLHRKCVNDSR